MKITKQQLREMVRGVLKEDKYSDVKNDLDKAQMMIRYSANILYKTPEYRYNAKDLLKYTDKIKDFVVNFTSIGQQW